MAGAGIASGEWTQLTRIWASVTLHTSAARFAKALRPGDRQRFDDFGSARTAYITIEHVNLQLRSGRMGRDDGKGRCPMTNGAHVPELVLE